MCGFHFPHLCLSNYSIPFECHQSQIIPRAHKSFKGKVQESQLNLGTRKPQVQVVRVEDPRTEEMDSGCRLFVLYLHVSRHFAIVHSCFDILGYSIWRPVLIIRYIVTSPPIGGGMPWQNKILKIPQTTYVQNSTKWCNIICNAWAESFNQGPLAQKW